MNIFDSQIKEYKALIIDKGKHTYLDKYIRNPEIDEEKLFILLCVINQANLSKTRKDNVVITTMLVQIALDIHDTVVKITEPNEGETKKRQKQLSVLAGDYYSGLYYSLLANSADLELIRVLASAIKDINEAKMELYYFAHDSLDTYIEIVRKVESLLFTRTAVYTETFAMEQLLGDWLLVNRLVQERNHLVAGDQTGLFLAWTENDTDFSNRLELIINEYKKRIAKSLYELPNHYEYIRDQMTRKLNHNFATPQQYMREKGK